MKILIDTNIIIHLEDNKVVDTNFSSFYQFAISNKCEVFYHSSCIRDIKRDRDLSRKEITLSKFKKYNPFPDPANITAEFIEMVGQKKENDEIDNIQLFQIYKGYADLFITEDLGIKEKAAIADLKSKVLTIEEGLKVLREKFTLVVPQHPSLIGCSIREIENNLSEQFFDSLRESYPGFNNWFLKCAKQNRKCYLLKVDSQISAILIYHLENSIEHALPGISDEALKMCTLKVDETVFGYRLGELFLQKMFALCIERKINYLYLTVFHHHEHLIYLLGKYGFKKEEFVNKNGAKELRMIKSLIKEQNRERSQAISSHPFYNDSSEVNKFVIPIQEKFYVTLFKDGSLREPTIFDGTLDALNEIEGNTISKAYLCKSKRNTMKSGDLLFFYSSGKHKTIEPIGILDQVIYTKDVEEINSLVKRKTVYTESQLIELIDGKKDITVLIFRLLYYLKKPIKFKDIKELESYSNNFQTITTLSENDYCKLKLKKHFDERFIIN
ncbi:MAG TPA: hypothetical protein VFJ43_00155 [Bacteroidia bacterium]|nr:hypothetical protein [Bacteroidia bacterium]